MLGDVDDNRFLDFASGIGVTNLGHRDPTVMQAIARQDAALSQRIVARALFGG